METDIIVCGDIESSDEWPCGMGKKGVRANGYIVHA